jgi:hypothetical protein
MKQEWLYTYSSALPPWIIMLYLYTKNAELVNVWQVLSITAVLSLLSLLCYFVVSRIGFSVTPPSFFRSVKKILTLVLSREALPVRYSLS